MLVQRNPLRFIYLSDQHRRAGAAIGIRCGSKKDLVTEWLF